MLVALAMAAVLAAPGACRTVHGRMDLWNGAPTVRIWVIGTRRILGVEQRSEGFDDLPPSVRGIWTGRDPEADWSRAIYGDFKVCALAPDRPGHMQTVRLVDARRLSARLRSNEGPVPGGSAPNPVTSPR
jgi:hypothetical protein